MHEPVSLGKFLFGWIPAAALSASVDPVPRLADALLIHIGGVAVPPVTCLLGLLGVLLARPLARKNESSGWLPFALVSIIMLITVELWIIESRPGALFAFVIAIGLGFSGYSLIELLGAEMANFAKRIIAIPTARLRDGPADPNKEDTEK